MSAPVVVAVEPGSAAARAGLATGDEVTSIDGVVPTDVIAWQLLLDEPNPTLEVMREGEIRRLNVVKDPGAPLGAEVDAAIFDRVRTCDNHCEFCFIYQLPPGLRRSLYLKDDDYRLSFLYGNFTTLTRFTELDLERVLEERLSPLYVSIHATDPGVRARMLRNRRGAYSLRWLSALLDGGVEVHGQVVVCPGVNDGAVLADTLLGVLDRFDGLSSLAVVPLGVSAHQREAAMRPHTVAEAVAVIDLCEHWQERFLDILGRRLVYASDEYYLAAGRPFPSAHTYGDFPMHEDGIGMARAFELEFTAAPANGNDRNGNDRNGNDRNGNGPIGIDCSERGPDDRSGDASEFEGAHGAAIAASGLPMRAPAAGFFSWVDGAPAEGYRAVRMPGGGANRSGELVAHSVPVSIRRDSNASGSNASSSNVSGESAAAGASEADPRIFRSAPLPGARVEAAHRGRLATMHRVPIGILTGTYGAAVLAPLVEQWQEVGHSEARVRIIEVENRFFGGNIGVTGLLTGADIGRVLQGEPDGHRYLLADVCLSGGKFIDGVALEELPKSVEVVPTNGAALRSLLDEAAIAAKPSQETV